LLDEIERVSDQLAMIHRGKVVLCGSLDEIKASHRRIVLRFEAPQPGPPTFNGALNVTGSGREWTALCNGGREEMFASVVSLGARVVSEHIPTLDEIFVARAGKKNGT
jgi:ABC-2 type transport system ATP-binding protein